MGTNLSHSAASRYMMCGRSYKYHYIDRIRPIVSNAALLFGSALDAGINKLLVGLEGNDVFEKEFTYAEINDKQVYVPTCTTVVYNNSDFDSDILIEDDYTIITKMCEETHQQHRDNYVEVYKQLNAKKQEQGFDSLTDQDKTFYNIMNWVSLRRKGFLMLVAYKEKVLPQIEEVCAIQKKISLKNEDGDEVIGYIDLIARLKDKPGVYRLDNKTSSIEYEKDSVLTSPQLSLYAFSTQEEYPGTNAGYIVLRKGVIKNRKKICSKCSYDGSGGRHATCNNTINGKRCGGEWNETISPEIDVQFITDEIPKATLSLVLENIQDINEAIKSNHFPRNLGSCQNWYGGNCVYFNKCYKNNDSGLECFKKENT